MSTFPIIDAFAKNWWVLLVRGLLAVLFGITAFAWPAATLFALVLLYGAYALVDGVTALGIGVSARAGWLILSGLIGVAVGIGTFFYPGITAVALFYLIAAGAIARGLLEIATAIELSKHIRSGGALILSGILSIGFGLLLAIYPAPGVLALAWLVGTYALLFGALMLALAWALRGLPARLELHEGKAA